MLNCTNHHLVLLLRKPDNAQTFGNLTGIYISTIQKVCSRYQWIDVFDRYREETIKCTTRTSDKKAARPIRRIIGGRDVPLRRNWNNFLYLAGNKADLSNFQMTKKLWLLEGSRMNVGLGLPQAKLIRLNSY